MQKFLTIWAYVDRGEGRAVPGCRVLEARDLADAYSILDAVIHDPAWIRDAYDLDADDDCDPVFDSGIDSYRLIALDDIMSASEGSPIFVPSSTHTLADAATRGGRGG